MSNEAAERLRAFGTYVRSDYVTTEHHADLDEALAAERRATVERIRDALLATKGDICGECGAALPGHDERDVSAILDAEAAR